MAALISAQPRSGERENGRIAVGNQQAECDIQAGLSAAMADPAEAVRVATGLLRWYSPADLSILLYRAIVLQAEHGDRLVGLEPVLLPAHCSLKDLSMQHSVGVCPLRVPRTEELD